MSVSRAQYTLRSTRVVLPSGVQPADVHVADGRIVSVTSPGLEPPRSDLHDAANLVIMPGVVDTHVHVNEPWRTEWEGFETASAAAAAGGVTTIVDMPLNSLPPTTDVRALDAKRRAAEKAHVNVEFWGGIVPGCGDDIDSLADAGVRGFKCFLSPSGVPEFPNVDPTDLVGVLPSLRRRTLPLLVHAEWPASLHAIVDTADRRAYGTWLDSRPEAAECDAVANLIMLCREYGAHIHVVHVASAAALDVIRSARCEGLPLTAETCPHYLTFAAGEIPDGATEFKCAPPIRDAAAREALWQALEDGTLDLIATDHSPAPAALKGAGDFVEAWGGIASLELGLAAVWTGAAARHIGLELISRWLSSAPAVLAGLAGRTGAIAAGMDADLVVCDPDAEWTVDQQRLHQRHKLTPYHGRVLRGRVKETHVRGRVVYRDRS